MPRLATLIAATVLTGAALPLAAAVPDILWERHPRGSGADEKLVAPVAALGPQGRLFVAAAEETATQLCVTLMSFSAGDGAELLRRTHCGTPGSQVVELAVDSRGDMVTAGFLGTASGVKTARLAKYSGSDGTLVWEVALPGSAIAFHVAVDRGDDVLAAVLQDTGEVSIVKLTADGRPRWTSPAVGYSAAGIAVDPAGYVLVAGRSGGDLNAARWTLTKLDAGDGRLVWQRPRAEGGATAHAIVLDGGGNAIVTGAVIVNGAYAAVTVKYRAADGAALWERVAQSTGEARAFDVAVNAQGDVAVTGIANDGSLAGRMVADLFVEKYRGGDGAVQWRAAYDGARGTRDNGRKLAFDAAGDVIVTGATSYTYDYDSNTFNRTLKYSGADGALLWSHGMGRTAGLPYQSGLSLHPMADGVVVLGYAWTGYPFIAKYGVQRIEPRNAQGLWWAAPAGSESGWGINLTHQGETLFGTWFTYDVDGSPTWLVMSAARNLAGDTYWGRVYRTNATAAYDAASFSPAQVTVAEAGEATITLGSDGSARFVYRRAVAEEPLVDKALVRQAFGPLPECALAFAPAANFQDLWWAAPAGSESGWGLNVAHQGEVLFVTWFTYGANGRATWYVGSEFRRAADGSYAGTLYQARGTYYGARWNAALRTVTPAGSGTLRFTGPSEGNFTYSVAGVTGSKAITRQVFARPATACR